MGIFAIVVYACMTGALLVGCMASLSLRPEVRGWRNLALLATYVLGFVSLFAATWYWAIGIWLGIGVIVGVFFAVYELIAERSAPPEERSGFLVSHVLYGPLAWPLMAMDLFENLSTSTTPESPEHAASESSVDA